MAAKTFGTAHLYGTASGISSATVVSFSLDKKHAIEDTVVNESGQAIERRYDDVMQEGTITLRIQSGYTIPEPGTTVSYDHDGAGAVVFEITSVGRAYEAQGRRQVTLGIRKSEYITDTLSA